MGPALGVWERCPEYRVLMSDGMGLGLRAMDYRCGEILGLRHSGVCLRFGRASAGRRCLPEVGFRQGFSGTHTCVYFPTELHPELPGPADRELTELLHGFAHRCGL